MSGAFAPEADIQTGRSAHGMQSLCAVMKKRTGNKGLYKIKKGGKNRLFIFYKKYINFLKKAVYGVSLMVRGC